MAEQGWLAELSHQRRRELVERVREDQDLEAVSQPVQEGRGSLEGGEAADHLVEVGQAQTVLGQDLEAPGHQHVVVRFVAGRDPQRIDPGALGHVDPVFGG